jgi:hypothetical protein
MGGGRVTITTNDDEALRTIHEFFRYPIREQKTADSSAIPNIEYIDKVTPKYPPDFPPSESVIGGWQTPTGFCHSVSYNMPRLNRATWPLSLILRSVLAEAAVLTEILSFSFNTKIAGPSGTIDKPSRKMKNHHPAPDLSMSV